MSWFGASDDIEELNHHEQRDRIQYPSAMLDLQALLDTEKEAHRLAKQALETAKLDIKEWMSKVHTHSQSILQPFAGLISLVTLIIICKRACLSPGATSSSRDAELYNQARDMRSLLEATIHTTREPRTNTLAKQVTPRSARENNTATR